MMQYMLGRSPDASMSRRYDFYWRAAVFAMTLGVLFQLLGHPFRNLSLVRQASVAEGQLDDVSAPPAFWGNQRRANYWFLVDGARFHASTWTSDPLRDVTVEYLAEAPAINRVRGDGPQGIFGVVLRAVALLLSFPMLAWLLFRRQRSQSAR